MNRRSINEIFGDIDRKIGNADSNGIEQQFNDFVQNHKKELEKKESKLKLKSTLKEMYGSFFAMPLGVASGILAPPVLLGGNILAGAAIAAVAAHSIYTLSKLETPEYGFLEQMDLEGREKIKKASEEVELFEEESVQLKSFFVHLNETEMAKGEESYDKYIEEIKEKNPEIYTQLAINVGGDVAKKYAEYIHTKMLENGEDSYISKLKEMKTTDYENSQETLYILRKEIGKEFKTLEMKANKELERDDAKAKMEKEIRQSLAEKERRKKYDLDKYGYKDSSNSNKNF